MPVHTALCASAPLALCVLWVVGRVLDATDSATRIRGEINIGNDMPDVNSDLRAFAAIGANLGSLRREAERPLDSAFIDEEMDEELGVEAA